MHPDFHMQIQAGGNVIWSCIVVFWPPSAAKQPWGQKARGSTIASPTPPLLFFMDQRSVEFAQNKNALLRPSSSEQFHFIAPMNSHDPFPSCSRAWSLRWHEWNRPVRNCSTVLCACSHSVLKSLGSGHFPDVAESVLQGQESAVILLEVSCSYLYPRRDNVGRVLVSIRALGYAFRQAVVGSSPF